MIKRVFANQPSFRPVEFTEGFNVVLADRTREATRKDSRNGLGKSTLIEIIHFCLGANFDKDVKTKFLPKEHLPNWEFSLDLSVGSHRVIVTRGVDHPKGLVVSGVPSSWPIQPSVRKGTASFIAKEWNLSLGHFLFGLPMNREGQSHSPSFRALISYFVRRRKDAYVTPFESFRKQQVLDAQINNAFLLGLAWEDVTELKTIDQRKKGIKALKTAIKSGVMQRFGGTLGALEARKVRLQGDVIREQDDLNSFRVHPQYEQIQADSNRLTGEIHAWVNANTVDRKLLELYGHSLSEESPPSVDAIDRVYQEAGVALPGMSLRRIEEVHRFHKTIISNRHAFLAAEVNRLKNEIHKRESLIRAKTKERAKLMKILQTHGALEEYTLLQQRHMQTVNDLNNVVTMIQNHRAFESGTSELEISQKQLHQKMRRDLDERKAIREEAIDLFNEYSRYLYDAPGNLVVDVDQKGFHFDVEIERSGSSGIDNMKIFCYDLMLAHLWSNHSTSPRVLIHDSLIFDGVDERQRARALELAARESELHGFQYICTLNSDMIPEKEFSPGFDVSKSVQLTLTDKNETGSLLGMRF
uniref:Uncharacterized protein YydD, contains DUF2326 domain n=1 Tax=Candidatus Kentrum sp. DK TaxID=2126562 RepID=A0A450T9P7_9GAMM|nr:MAG: Uncharacterized protein YydD, contains DUF2326 domain [Candidatus Kentron sp. DK]